MLRQLRLLSAALALGALLAIVLAYRAYSGNAFVRSACASALHEGAIATTDDHEIVVSHPSILADSGGKLLGWTYQAVSKYDAWYQAASHGTLVAIPSRDRKLGDTIDDLYEAARVRYGSATGYCPPPASFGRFPAACKGGLAATSHVSVGGVDRELDYVSFVPDAHGGARGWLYVSHRNDNGQMFFQSVGSGVLTYWNPRDAYGKGFQGHPCWVSGPPGHNVPLYQ